jgi:hypothetical protein
MFELTDIFEIKESAFGFGIDQLHTDPFADVPSFESMGPAAFNANNKPSNPIGGFEGAQ